MNKVFDSRHECQKSNNKPHFLFDDTAQIRIHVEQIVKVPLPP
jgi:hypothetical protein